MDLPTQLAAHFRWLVHAEKNAVMDLPTQLAAHFRGVFFGGNWTAVCLKDTLQGVDYQQATHQPAGFNSIAGLVFHIRYYVGGVLRVLEGGPLSIHDRFSFDLPPLASQADWEQLLAGTWAEAETFAGLLEALPEKKLTEVFVEEKYGTYYRNLHGLIEHTHYHLGQIVLLKKLQAPAGHFSL